MNERVRRPRHARRLHATTSRAARRCRARCAPSSSDGAVQDRRDGHRLRQRRARRRSRSTSTCPAGSRTARPRSRACSCVGSVYHHGPRRPGRRRRRPPSTPRRTSTSTTRPSSRSSRQAPDRHRRARRRRPAARRVLQRRAPTTSSGNGGVHFYRVDRLTQATPATAAGGVSRPTRAGPTGKKAIYRAADPHRRRRAAFCTAHVFQQIPGQNRIFMGWYSQGTQVIDFTENAGRHGPTSRRPAGSCPTNANTWVSHVFKYQANPNGTFTYWGATGDFNLGHAGRSAIDVYKVTLPPPPRPSTAAPESRLAHRDDLLRETAGITHRSAVLSPAGARAAPSGRGGGSRPGPRRPSARRRGPPR